MELNVNSIAYYKDHYPIDNEAYNFFQKAYLFFLDKEYRDTQKNNWNYADSCTGRII